ncbi:phospholipid/cholesterol/gamma-HCH transport system substrate-binding protein [Actinomadura pelletieri DSM 43383]|uniref:Phospholipid/cholesterol/gamma-HCH transport system substrate-binding protein n=1 Tax=Actinomadura pelletieri DSM 43383 TaxID=1120940 RepID=A0A495QRF4_9ACTN|nr:MCE family protein [Actinomadura pelletieri]RKS76068.1 phospholipid/cholesterol/gamma-HCH transport system substrate-binding protein [Actinomadura pelletieri DSM 43383]
MRVSFRERNPVPIGLAGFAVITVLVVLALNLESVPFVSGGTTYTAAFKEAAGLKTDEEVRVAGVKVGEVTGLELDGDHVTVTFRVDEGVRLGDRTEAGIKIKTVLGAHYLALTPRGEGRLGRHIPIERTHVPFEIVPAISELTRRVGAIDVRQVARSFDVLAATFENSPDEVRASLEGLRRLSRTVASRDEQLHELAGKARDVTKLLADRNQDFARLVQDGDRVLQAVRARRAVIHQLLLNTVALSQQVNALIRENEKQLRPMLDDLAKVNRVLLKNQDNLDRILQLFAPFARQFADVTGTGRWFDSWIQNLVPIPASLQPPGGTSRKPADRPGKTGDPLPLPFLP